MEKNLDRILSDQKSKTKLSLLIFFSLFAAAAFLLSAGQIMGWVFLAMSLIIGATVILRIRRNREELAKLGDAAELQKKLDAWDTVYYPMFNLTVGTDFAVLEKPSLQVYPFRDMEKFEVGLAGDVRKVLFLTDREGRRHPVAETSRDDDKQADFDRVYNQVRTLFAQRTN
nr:hypothetical protein [Lachnospiraceae bacterium]